VGEVPALCKLLEAHGASLPAAGVRYIRDFIDSVAEGERAERSPLFADLFAAPAQASAAGNENCTGLA
jgi:hypothetical protein